MLYEAPTTRSRGQQKTLKDKSCPKVSHEKRETKKRIRKLKCEVKTKPLTDLGKID